MKNMPPLSRLLAGLGALSIAAASSSRRQAPEEGVLECFQVAQPVLGPDGVTPSWGEAAAGDGEGACEVLLMEHSFGASYDRPFVGMSPTHHQPHRSQHPEKKWKGA